MPIRKIVYCETCAESGKFLTSDLKNCEIRHFCLVRVKYSYSLVIPERLVPFLKKKTHQNP